MGVYRKLVELKPRVRNPNTKLTYRHSPCRQEYNESCVEIRDLEWLSPDTKVSWSATRRMGPLQARDFVTIVHYRRLEDGTMLVVNRPAEHPDAR